jgi:hydrogenase maturation protease
VSGGARPDVSVSTSVTDWTTCSPLGVARQVADAVLYEGYVLFPYRASAAKNRYRWQWGVVVPSGDTGRVGEPDAIGCDLLVRGTGEVRLHARFLRLRRRQVVDADGTPVDSLEVDGQPVVSWDEGDEVEVVLGPVSIGDLVTEPVTLGHACPAEHASEPLPGGGRVDRDAAALELQVEVECQPLGDGVTRLRVHVRNVTPGAANSDERHVVLARALVGVHVLAVADDPVRFASLLDPPDWAAPHVGACCRDGLHPVLVGPPGVTSSVVLAAPIILPDHPETAPESPGPSFDATEVDELLALAVMGLTDEEKAEARATDPRAADLVDRTDALPGDVLQRLHGRLHDLDTAPAPGVVSDEVADLLGVGDRPTERIRVGDRWITLGSRVRLRPRRRADAHDMFIDGRLATVEKIVTTVEGDTMLGVTLVEDPAAPLHRWYGRFQYFDVAEVEVADRAASAPFPRVLVAGVGNLFLGDDGFGPEVARALQCEPLPDGVRVHDYGVGGIHLAYDVCDGVDVLVLVDTLNRDDTPGALFLLEVGEDELPATCVDAHAMDPAAMLATVETLGGTRPRTLLVGCVPSTLQEGIGLSKPVAAAVVPAVAAVRELIVRLHADGVGADLATVHPG